MIDIFFYILIILAVVHGWRRGLLIALFSLVCGWIGLAAAVKFSAVLSTHLKSDLHVSERWLPVLAFVIIFIIVLLVIRLLGKLLDQMMNWVLLGWLNKLGGILFFVLLYTSIYSIILFYGTQTRIISKHAIEDSNVYPVIAPFGPTVIRFITGFIPLGQDMFSTLEAFFGRMANRMH